MRKIHDVRSDLKYWGAFWARQEQGQGYASKSNIEALRETLQRGCAVVGTAYLVNHLADNIKVPDEIAKIDHMVEQLKQKHRVAIRCFYINAIHSRRTLLVLSAERELL